VKNAISLVSAMLVLALAVNSHAAGWTIGVKGGVNMAELYGDNAPDGMSMRNGIAAGAFAANQLNDRFGIRGEVLYMEKGAEADFVIPGDDHAHDSVVKLDYVEIPVLFTGRFPAGEKFAFNLFAGPTLAFITTAEVEVVEHNETESLDDVVESFEIGATFGGGIEYALSSFSLLADVRYGIGTTTVVQDVAGQAFDIKNRGVGIMAGVAFPLGQ
jgi:hypothetical protein